MQESRYQLRTSAAVTAAESTDKIGNVRQAFCFCGLLRQFADTLRTPKGSVEQTALVQHNKHPCTLKRATLYGAAIVPTEQLVPYTKAMRWSFLKQWRLRRNEEKPCKAAGQEPEKPAEVVHKAIKSFNDDKAQEGNAEIEKGKKILEKMR